MIGLAVSATLAILLAAASASAQEIYITTTGWASRSCPRPTASPKFYQNEFQYSISDTLRYATPLPSPTATTKFAKNYSEASILIPNLSTTTWGSWMPGETAVTANDTDDKYGMAAWQQIWVNADIQNYTYAGRYSTTVSPTPVPSSSLILPPKNYFGPSDCYEIPEDFVVAAASAAGQVEGAIGMEGRTPGLLEFYSTNNQDDRNYVTIEQYYLYKQDIAMMAAAGLEYYHFTISWSRILPFGVAGTPVNQQAIEHYDDVINTILEYGMKPIVTIMHFDTPLMFIQDEIKEHPVQDSEGLYYFNGGMQNATWPDAFVYYGKVVLAHYADRVPIWISNNSPWLWGVNDVGVHNCIKTHADLYHFYHDDLKGTGKFGMKIGVAFPVPQDPYNTSHIEASQRFLDMYMGVLAYPMMLGEQYPDAYIKTIANVTLFTAEELQWIGHTADFYGINAYTSQVVSPPPSGIEACSKNSSDPYWPYCVIRGELASTGWAIGVKADDATWNTPYYAIREGLKYLWNKYKAPIIITEFGFVVPGEDTAALPSKRFDTLRTDYYLSYLSEMLKAMYEDGVEVIGTIAWSAFDSWEFPSLNDPYGLIYNNLTTQERSYKKSFFDYVDFFGTRKQSSKKSPTGVYT